MAVPLSHVMPMSEQEMTLCCELVMKVRQQGRFDELMQRVCDEEKARAARMSMSAGYTSGSAAMTDASKRLRGESSTPEDFEVVNYTAPTEGVPMPGESMPPSQFPPGIHSLKEWGEYYVAFGKFENKKKYHQVYTEMTEEMISYRKYLYSNRKECSAQFKDLVLYMEACGGRVSQGPVIPGTNIVRRK